MLKLARQDCVFKMSDAEDISGGAEDLPRGLVV